jgi:hypothetical protein
MPPCTQAIYLDIVEHVAVGGHGGALALELEYNHPRVMARGKQVVLRMRGEDPEPVVFPPAQGAASKGDEAEDSVSFTSTPPGAGEAWHGMALGGGGTSNVPE